MNNPIKEIDISIMTNTAKKVEISEEKMALNISELFGDFDVELQKQIEKTIIDYYLTKGE